MLIERSGEVALRLILADILHEATVLRSTDPVTAAQLDAAAGELLAVIEEPDMVTAPSAHVLAEAS